MSHPLRVRGLKPSYVKGNNIWAESHPLRVRGLKLADSAFGRLEDMVAPPAGAWIETSTYRMKWLLTYRRTPCGCVD